MRWPILIVVAQLAMASSAAAQVEAPVLGGRLRAVVGSGGQLGPLAPVLDGTVGAEGLGVSIRFVSDDIARWAPEVEKTGVVLHHRDGEPVCVGRVCGAYAPFDSVDALAAAPGVERVEAGWIALRRRPLFQTVGEVGGRHAHTRDGGGTLTGSGVTIGDIDEPIDVFHPAFLRADGGFFAWIDADGDGVFGTGDAVDRDRDGGADADERIRVLDSTRVWFDPVRRYEENRDGVFQPDLDWVYIDGNDNGHRDYGVGAGYFERDPGYGEPIFLADDVDEDGVLDPDERLIELESPKVSSLVWGDVRFTRGSDLIYADTREDLRNDDGPLVSGHGTGVAGVLGAGAPGRSRLTGVAPDADLVSLVQMDDVIGDPMVTVMDAAESLGVDVLLYELASWNFVPLDGSSNVEVAMSTLRAGGMVQVAATGNLASSGKHTRRTIDTAGTSIALEVPSHVLDRVPVGAVLLSLHWNRAEAGQAPTMELVAPAGDRFALDGSAATGALWLGDHVVQEIRDVTPGGTETVFVYFGTEDGTGSMRHGSYRLDVTAAAGAFDMHVFIDDFWSSWAPGAGVGEPDPTTTMCWPSTGDAAFAVGAYGGVQDQPWDEPGSLRGELRHYSSRGPRMDGAHGVDMVAPDDPLSPVPGGDVEPASYGWYGRFGGTSGAAPHVAGAFALLKQARPSASVAELEQALIDAALQDLATGDLPDPDIGWGKLRFFDAIDPALREDNAPPELGLAVVESNAVMIDARGTTDAEGDEVVYVVDLDYDGDPDLGPTSDPLLVLDAPLGEYLAVVYGFDGRGGRDGQVVHGVVTDVPAEFGEGPEPTPDTGADAGSDLADAGNPRPDAGATTPGTSRKRGCGVSGRQPPRASWLLAGMVAVVRRRRRRGITLAR